MRHTAGANSCAAAPVLILLGFRNGRDRFDVAAVESCGIKDASNSSGTLARFSHQVLEKLILSPDCRCQAGFWVWRVGAGPFRDLHRRGPL